MESIKKSKRSHKTWLQNYTGNSLAQYTRTWEFFEEYLRESSIPKDEQWVLDNFDQDWGAQLIEFHRWLKNHSKSRGHGTLSDNTARVHANGIRRYLQHIGIGLGLTRIQKLEITKIESMPMKDFAFDLVTKEKLLGIADPIGEYIVSVGISLGLRIGDFLRLTRGQFEPLLDREPPIAMGKIITKKEGIPAFPFLDGDGVYAVKRLLKQMDREGRKGKDEKMLNMTPKTVNNKLKALFERSGLPLGSYRIRFHCLRKFISDALASVCSSDKWRWFVGKVTKSPYVSSEGRESYKRVLRLTQVNGSGKAKLPRESIEAVMKQLNSTMGRIKELEKVLTKGPDTQFFYETSRNQIEVIESMIKDAKSRREHEPQEAEKHDARIKELEELKARVEASMRRMEQDLLKAERAVLQIEKKKLELDKAL